ncbi:MAG: ArsI/CadI family heavy metal resistance metalloenzyme [Vulcanimicrobiaceae bacterium]
MKIHLNLGVSELEKSVAFYRTLLNLDPAKQLSDYALFIGDDPGIELALDLDAAATADLSAHFGIVVETADAVKEATLRLKSAGYRADVETDETCCYARQTKVWTSDPDGRRWETYVVHEDTDERDDSSCCVA